jgi:hypothetical protein
VGFPSRDVLEVIEDDSAVGHDQRSEP